MGNRRSRPPAAIPASKHSRRERPESRWSSHSSRLQARRAISKAARQGSATPASMKSCSNGRRLAKRIVAIDPEPSPAALQCSHRNRLKPPLNLRHRGTPTFPDWMPTTEGKDRARPWSTAMRPARCQGGWLRSQCPAGTRVRVRSARHLVTPTVHRPPRTTPGRRVPALAKRAIPTR
jgi:hypothetical protein